MITKSRLSLSFLLICLFLTLSSHDLFFKAQEYMLLPGQKSLLFLHNGTFFQSDNSIARSRMVDPVVIGPDYHLVPDDKNWYARRNVTYMEFRAGPAGTYLGGLSTKPSNIELSATAFNDYLLHDGVVDILEQRRQDGSFNQDAKEKYAKHVKIIFQVGQNLTEHYKEVLGYPLEFVPLSNPYGIRLGEELQLQLLHEGKPLANQLVFVDREGGKGGGEATELALRTDGDGIFSFVATYADVWFIRTIYMVPCTEDDLDYQSDWATLTFQIGKKS